MKKTHKLLILVALVCTLLVCGMMSASAAKEIEWEGGTYYTDDDEKYVFYDDSYSQIIGVTDNFTNTGLEFCGFCTVDGEIVYPIGYGINNNDSYKGAIYPLKTFSQFTITASPKVTGESVLNGQIIFVSAFSWMTVEGKFKIPYNVTAIAESAFAFTRVGSFDVADNNKYFHDDENGILYGRYYNLKGEFTGNDCVIMAPDKTVDHIDIPDNVTDIYSYAYYYYKAKTINIPTSVTRIGGAAFPCLALGSTDKFDAVYYEGTIDQWNKITIEDSNGRITKAHLYCNDWYTVSEQGCFTDEVERRDCHCSDDCGEYETRVIKEAFGSHNFTEQLGAVRSTCATQGYIEYHCSRCNRVKVYEPLDETNHEGPYEDCSEYIAATCCTEGLEANKRCSACKVQTYTGTTISATGNHIYGDWYATEAPTCCQEGVERRDCTVGEAYETRVATPTGNHSFGDWYVTLEPTCAITGIERRDCTLGEAFETRDIPVSDIHTYGNNWQIYEPATCAAVGTEISYCTVCFGAPITREIPKTDDHSWRNWANVIVATCTTSGTEERVCNRCKATESRETEIVDHRFNGGAEVITEPTCRKNGTKEVKCIWYDQCGETELKQIRSVNHTYENYEVTTPATCINTGIETAKCKWYDECYTTRSNTIPATGTHIFDKPYESLRGQCDREGYIKYKCTADPDCTEIKTETLAVDPEFHNSGLNYDVGKKDPTCCADGYSGDTTCIGCGVVIVKGEVIPATGEHVWKEAEIFGGNCKISGYIKYRCENGTAEHKEDLGINNSIHYKTEVRNYKAGNCQTNGYTGDKYCTHCNALISKGKEVKGSHVGRQKCSICGYNVCGCQLCHGNGFERFIMKMFLWIYKIFGQNKSCRCGNVHY